MASITANRSRNVLLDYGRAKVENRATCRQYSFLGVHDFFKRCSQSVERAPHNSSPTALTSAKVRGNIRKYLSSASRGAVHPPPKLDKAEQMEWLEDNIPDSSEGTVSLLNPAQNIRESNSRFDWRLRAPSRLVQPNQKPRVARKLAAVKIPRQGDPFHAEIGAYTEKFLPLLQAEQADEDARIKERLSTWSLERLQSEGFCIQDMSAFQLSATHLGRPVMAFQLRPGELLPENHFNVGVDVLISRSDPLTERPMSGKVVSRNDRQIKIAFEKNPELEDSLWRLDVGRSDMVYNRMRKAIEKLQHDPAIQDKALASNSVAILQGTYLRDILLRTYNKSSPNELATTHELSESNIADTESPSLASRQPESRPGIFKDNQLIHSWTQRYSKLNPVIIEGDPEFPHLNVTQVRALACMLGEQFSLIQGPPGTGKTKIIVEAIKLLKVHFQIVHPILVCTYTNVAVDHLTEALVAAGIRPLRSGFVGKVKKKIYPHTLDHQMTIHPLWPAYNAELKNENDLLKTFSKVSKQIANTESNSGPSSAWRSEKLRSQQTAYKNALNSASRRKWQIQQDIVHEILTRADVVCTTCVSSASAALSATDFPVVFLDEATMATEPASLIPLMKGSQHVALIGDHRQLPPVVVSEEARQNGLAVSLFERLTEEGVLPSVMLNTQYRMHPSISDFPSGHFYNATIQNGTVDVTGEAHVKLNPPKSSQLRPSSIGRATSVVFLDHKGPEKVQDRSRVNYNEAHIICSIIEDLLLNNEDLSGDDIGIIAPYAAQINLLYRMLKTDEKIKARFSASLGRVRSSELSLVEIKTVDGFEGREKEVIIFSTVRNNASGYIGFLADRRRLNVGLTRAKRGLFVIGSLATLKRGRVGNMVAASRESVRTAENGSEAWRRYIGYLLERDQVIKLEGLAENGLRRASPEVDGREAFFNESILMQEALDLARSSHPSSSARPTTKVLLKV